MSGVEVSEDSLSHPPGFSERLNGDYNLGSGCYDSENSVTEEIRKTIETGHQIGFKMDGCLEQVTRLVNREGKKKMKMELIDFLVVRSLWGNASCCYAYSPSRGNLGVEGVWVSSGVEVVFVSVYAPQGTDSKRQLWGEIGQLMNSCSGEFVLMGDFNEVRDESECMGSQFHPASTRIFNQFIEDANLFDIALGGPRFTRSDKWGSKFSKLDRFLVSKGLLVLFPHLSLASWIGFWNPWPTSPFNISWHTIIQTTRALGLM
ncbi:unnamed protein product [Lactuca saligna]|uniref:Endonuclease/exonuclease/phosphatase domain-containing protein n=1 Tax=Lactuca saligna TaxID=75948 RepID=A0AA35ZLF9_LACSI|nr:unnamed protein product [Lactuca saligna]